MAWAGAGAGGRAGTPPAEAAMPQAALQAARGAPLAGLASQPVSAEIGSVLRRSMGPRRPIYSSGEVSVFVVLV